MIPLVLQGAAGRMGQAVAQAASTNPEFAIKGLVDVAANLRPHETMWSGDLDSVVTRGDVVIDFSAPAGCRAAARACLARGAALVTGTTGLSAADERAVAEAAAAVVVVRAANFSLGLAALRHALAAAMSAVPDWDIEIVERHHRAKVDSPSGTALALARDTAAARGRTAEPVLRFGREGRAGPRAAGEIGVHAVRGGTWVGDHAVLLAGEGEWLELRHVAQDRLAFAHGALAAARFAARRSAPGLYNIEDVLSEGSG